MTVSRLDLARTRSHLIKNRTQQRSSFSSTDSNSWRPEGAWLPWRLYAWPLVLLAVFLIFNGDYFAGSRVFTQQFKGIPQHFPLQIAHPRAPKAAPSLDGFR